jgi:hypothetical protein
MAYVYLLSVYDESGTNAAMRATLDRTMLPAMLRAYAKDDDDCHEALRKLLETSDEELAQERECGGCHGAIGHDLSADTDDGPWLQLHVVRLSERQTLSAA